MKKMRKVKQLTACYIGKSE